MEIGNDEQRMDADLRIRLPEGLKAELEVLARRRMLKASDIAREALVHFVRTHEKEAA